MSDWAPANAMLSMMSPLGVDELIPVSLSAQEEISQPFHFEIKAVSQKVVIKPDDLLNQAACVTRQGEGSPVRYVEGIVRSVTDQGIVRGAGRAQDYDCRICQKMSADDILNAMFKDAGLTDMSIIRSGSPRALTVQFNETDVQFATRLMEEESWIYSSTYEDSEQRLVVATNNAAFSNVSNATLHRGGGGGDTTALIDFRGPETSGFSTPEAWAGQPAVQPAPHPTGTAVGGAVAPGAARGDARRRTDRLKRFLESGRNIAAGGPRRLREEER
jgi:type VI secretion system secreted protein VgrG